MNDKVRTINGLHLEAMEFTDQSFVARRFGDREKYLHYTRLALDKEAQAADLMVDEDVEPTRSVLHRSAATLAWRCKEYEKSKRLIYRALAGNPPPDIEFELNDLLGDVNLAQAGIHLEENRIQVSLNGNAVGYGNASVVELGARVSCIRKMLKIAAKFAVRHFDEFSPSKLISDSGEIPLYIEGIYPGSCNVSLRLGKPIQTVLPGFENSDEIIAPFLQNLDFFEKGNYDALEEAIVDIEDLRGFFIAAKELAPDGDRITSIKFQAKVKEKIKRVSFNRIQSELNDIQLPKLPETTIEYQTTNKDISKTGVLRVANALGKTECVLVTEDSAKWTIEGPEDILDEIVREFFKRKVEVTGKQMKKKKNRVNRIRLANTSDVSAIDDQNRQESTDVLILPLPGA